MIAGEDAGSRLVEGKFGVHDSSCAVFAERRVTDEDVVDATGVIRVRGHRIARGIPRHTAGTVHHSPGILEVRASFLDDGVAGEETDHVGFRIGVEVPTQHRWHLGRGVTGSSDRVVDEQRLLHALGRLPGPRVEMGAVHVDPTGAGVEQLVGNSNRNERHAHRHMGPIFLVKVDRHRHQLDGVDWPPAQDRRSEPHRRMSAGRFGVRQREPLERHVPSLRQVLGDPSGCVRAAMILPDLL